MPSKPQRRRRDAEAEERVPTERSLKAAEEQAPVGNRRRLPVGTRPDRERAKVIDAP